jgi:hypothetical protein
VTNLPPQRSELTAAFERLREAVITQLQRSNVIGETAQLIEQAADRINRIPPATFGRLVRTLGVPARGVLSLLDRLAEPEQVTSPAVATKGTESGGRSLD